MATAGLLNLAGMATRRLAVLPRRQSQVSEILCIFVSYPRNFPRPKHFIPNFTLCVVEMMNYSWNR